MMKDLTPYPLRNSLGFRLQRTFLKLRQAVNASFRAQGHDITVDQWSVLNLLWEADGRTPVELAAHLDKDRPNVTRLVETLVDKGFVRRSPDADDRRSYKVFLTEQGAGFKETLIPIPARILTDACRELSQEQVDELFAMLDSIHSNTG